MILDLKFVPEDGKMVLYGYMPMRVEDFKTDEGAQYLLVDFNKFSWKRVKVEALSVHELLKAPISYLYLSRRAKNCLRGGNIDTIGQLVKYTRSNLLKIKTLGRNVLLEIEQTLLQEGLGLGMTDQEINDYKE